MPKCYDDRYNTNIAGLLNRAGGKIVWHFYGQKMQLKGDQNILQINIDPGEVFQLEKNEEKIL